MDKYNLFFTLSILTDTSEFERRFINCGVTPFHDLEEFDWSSLESSLLDILIKDYPEHRSSVTVRLFNDSLESASKSLLSESQHFHYLKELVTRARNDNFEAQDLRTQQWCTTYCQSAPPQDFNGMIRVEDDGSADILEDVINAIVSHFYAKASLGGLMMMPMLFSGQLMPHCQLSDQMLDLFASSFNHPFANDVHSLFFNDADQERFVLANNMMEYEAARNTDHDEILAYMGLR